MLSVILARSRKTAAPSTRPGLGPLTAPLSVPKWTSFRGHPKPHFEWLSREAFGGWSTRRRKAAIAGRGWRRVRAQQLGHHRSEQGHGQVYVPRRLRAFRRSGVAGVFSPGVRGEQDPPGPVWPGVATRRYRLLNAPKSLPGVAETARRENILCVIRALHQGGTPRRVASPAAPWTSPSTMSRPELG